MQIPIIERELSEDIGNPENHCVIESVSQFRGNHSQENTFGQYGHEGTIPRQDKFQETMETFTSEITMMLSQEMNSMMSMMHTQINRAITSAIAERVIPEIQNIVSSSGNWDTESGLSPDSQEVREDKIGCKSKITKKDCRSAVDLSPYTMIPA